MIGLEIRKYAVENGWALALLTECLHFSKQKERFLVKFKGL